jgi:hypothetical protein
VSRSSETCATIDGAGNRGKDAGERLA